MTTWINMINRYTNIFHQPGKYFRCISSTFRARLLHHRLGQYKQHKDEASKPHYIKTNNSKTATEIGRLEQLGWMFFHERLHTLPLISLKTDFGIRIYTTTVQIHSHTRVITLIWYFGFLSVMIGYNEH